MNEKFYNLPQEKQDLIINAAYKVFANNPYKKAPMSEIAEEGQISKALLFHYFTNKFELYTFLWNKAKKLTNEAEKEVGLYETDDFFEMLRRGLKAKCRIMRKYTYISLFSINAFYETEPQVASFVGEQVETATDSAYLRIAENVNLKPLRKDVAFESIYKEVIYASEGLVDRLSRKGNIDIDEFESEYLKLIEHWERIYTEV